MKRYVKLPQNTKGRDIIAPDLHGCVDLLYRKLDAINLDPAVDRLLCVGDLPDRGPESLKTLELLNQHWFQTVPGNHEAMMLTYLRRRNSRFHSPSDFLRNGGDWIEKLTESERARLEAIADKVEQLPLALIVDAPIPFNVTHGDLTPLGMTQTELEADEEVGQHTADSCMWSRHLVNTVDDIRKTSYDGSEIWLSEEALIPELNMTYAGHTILRAPIVHRSHVYIDQGAYVSIKPDAGRLHPSAKLQLIDHRLFSQWLQTKQPQT